MLFNIRKTKKKVSLKTLTANYEITRRLHSVLGGLTVSYLVLTNVKKSNCRFFFAKITENYRGSQRVKRRTYYLVVVWMVQEHILEHEQEFGILEFLVRSHGKTLKYLSNESLCYRNLCLSQLE